MDALYCPGKRDGQSLGHDLRYYDASRQYNKSDKPRAKEEVQNKHSGYATWSNLDELDDDSIALEDNERNVVPVEDPRNDEYRSSLERRSKKDAQRLARYTTTYTTPDLGQNRNDKPFAPLDAMPVRRSDYMPIYTPAAASHPSPNQSLLSNKTFPADAMKSDERNIANKLKNALLI